MRELECRFSIANICVSLVSTDPKLNLGTIHARQNFIVHNTTPDSIVSACCKESLTEISGKLLFDSGALWKLYFHDDQYHFSFTSPLLGSQPYKIASFHRDFSSGQISIQRSAYNSDQIVDPLEYPLDELLILHLLSRGLGVEVHACGLIDPFGNGVLFAGQSGAGKTTIATLLNKQGRLKILSDDRIVLTKRNGKIRMHGTPWHGESKFASPAEAELKQIYFLRQYPQNEIVSVKPSDAVARLFACSFPLFYNTSAVDFMLSFYEDLITEVPHCVLRFAANDEIIDFLNYVETVSKT